MYTVRPWLLDFHLNAGQQNLSGGVMLIHLSLLPSISNLLNPKSPNGDQYQISPCNINAYSIPEVMRIKDMITQGEFS